MPAGSRTDASSLGRCFFGDISPRAGAQDACVCCLFWVLNMQGLPRDFEGNSCKV